MKHVLFALFPNRDQAEAAMRDLALAGIPEDRCNLIMHQGRLEQGQESVQSETDAREGLVLGLVVGGASGGVLGAVLAGPVNVLSVNPGLAAAFGIAGGAILGALGGLLQGSALPDRKLRELARSLGNGRTLVTAEVEGMTAQEKVELIFRRHQAVESHKPIL